MNKQEWLRCLSRKTIADYFSDKVESVEIEYTETYVCFAGRSVKSYKLMKSRSSDADFYIECPNWECTVGVIDLRSEVDELYREKREYCKGEKKCKGKVAPDHPNQRCDTTISYEIRITYSK